ncbi:hypothetical protein H9P43_007049 [Blastocladiella emersonii ATCC 22665]|nr:hypothetical protein H9P43_007049 [Blastocladiella emersonii ATCC 22665]
MVKQNFVGTVLRTALGECKVRVERHVEHARVHKLVPFHKSFIVHDPKQAAKPGDVVRIQSIKPITPIKYFAVAEIIQHGMRAFNPATGREEAYIPDGFVKDYSKFPAQKPKKGRR